VKPVPSGKATKRDYELARIARKWGADYCTRIILECRAHGVAISDGFALVEQESDFKNIFGCDHGAGKAFCHMAVTKSRVDALLASPLSNGVGPTQLTSKGYVRDADRDGGAHKPAVNIATGIAILGALQKKHGRMVGFGAYNGGESNPNMDYARKVDEKADRWHRRFV
jgi:hypothetical protein